MSRAISFYKNREANKFFVFVGDDLIDGWSYPLDMVEEFMAQHDHSYLEVARRLYEMAEEAERNEA